MNQQQIIDLLKAEVLPTMGCTEPGAVALAAASAASILPAKADISRIDVTVNPNIYKNGVAVGIPGTGETGLPIAAALGALKRTPEKQLAVLANVGAEELARARALVADKKIFISVDDAKKELWVRVRVASNGDWSEAIIREKHHNIVSLQKNGEFVFDHSGEDLLKQPDNRDVLRAPGVTIAEIVRTVEAIPLAKLEFLLEGVEMNLAAAEAGVTKELGMGIGAMYDRLTSRGLLASDIISYAKTLTAAAADAADVR